MPSIKLEFGRAISNNISRLDNKIKELQNTALAVNTLQEENESEHRKHILIKELRKLEAIRNCYQILLKETIEDQSLSLLKDTLDFACKIIFEPETVTLKDFEDHRPVLTGLARVAEQEQWENKKTALYYGAASATSLILGVGIIPLTMLAVAAVMSTPVPLLALLPIFIGAVLAATLIHSARPLSFSAIKHGKASAYGEDLFIDKESDFSPENPPLKIVKLSHINGFFKMYEAKAKNTTGSINETAKDSNQAEYDANYM